MPGGASGVRAHPASCSMPGSEDGGERTEVQGTEGAVLYVTVAGGPLYPSSVGAAQTAGFDRLGKRAASEGFDPSRLDEQNRHVIAAQVGFYCQSFQIAERRKLAVRRNCISSGSVGETNELAVRRNQSSAPYG